MKLRNEFFFLLSTETDKDATPGHDNSYLMSRDEHSMPLPIMPPQSTKSTCALGDAVTYLPETTKGKTAIRSVCKTLVCGKEKQALQSGCLPVQGGTSIELNEPEGQGSPRCCFNGRAAAKHLSLLWKAGAGLGVCRRGLTEERQLC